MPIKLAYIIPEQVYKKLLILPKVFCPAKMTVLDMEGTFSGVARIFYQRGPKKSQEGHLTKDEWSNMMRRIRFRNRAQRSCTATSLKAAFWLRVTVGFSRIFKNRIRNMDCKATKVFSLA